MKKNIVFLSFFTCFNVFANDPVIEFNLTQGKVTYQLNTQTGAMLGIIKDNPQGICVQKMPLTSKNNNQFVYEQYGSERNLNYYSRFEINLNNNQAVLFSSVRNIVSNIPIEIRSCSTQQCSNLSNIPLCSN